MITISRTWCCPQAQRLVVAAGLLRYPHLKQQGRCEVHKREAPEGEEDTLEWAEEELEEGPEQLAVLEADTEVDGGPAWSPLFSSSNDQVKNQVKEASCYAKLFIQCDKMLLRLS